MAAYTGTPALPPMLAGDVPLAATDWAGILGALHGVTDPWTPYGPAWTAATTNPAIGNGSITSRYAQVGKLAIYTGNITFGTTTTYGSGAWRIGIPGTIQNGAFNVGAVALFGVSKKSAICWMATSTDISLTSEAGDVTATTPYAWASGHQLRWTFIGELA